MNELLFVAIAVVAFLFGARATFRLWRRYERTAPLLEPRERLVLLAFVLVSVICTTAAALIAFISGRRLLGYQPLEGSALALSIIATVILFIPVGLDLLVSRIARVR